MSVPVAEDYPTLATRALDMHSAKCCAVVLCIQLQCHREDIFHSSPESSPNPFQVIVLPGYFRIIVCKNVTPTTAVSCSVATLPSESLRNDGEKPNQSKRRLFPKCGYDKYFRKVRSSVTQQKWYS